MKKLIFSIFISLFLNCLCFGEICAQTELTLNSKNAILYDTKCKRILFEKDAYEKVPNASTTKILTAIVTVENCDLNEVVEIGQNAVNVTGSRVKFRKGDKITVNDLIKGMLLCSGNDAAIALAEHVSGTVEDFCKLMNTKAKIIGANDTNFLSPHGLDIDGHYSTAYDLAIIADYALTIPYLANIFSKSTETIYINNSPRKISTTNEMLYVYPNANGVKTGFTNKAGRCLVTSATNDEGWQLISVVLGCDTKNFRTQDSKKLLDYGFNNYTIVNIGKILPKNIFFEVEKSREKFYKMDIKFDFYYPLLENEKNKLSYKQSENFKFVAPLAKNTEITNYKLMLNDKEIAEVSIKLDCEIKRKSKRDYFKELITQIPKNVSISL